MSTQIQPEIQSPTAPIPISNPDYQNLLLSLAVRAYEDFTDGYSDYAPHWTQDSLPLEPDNYNFIRDGVGTSPEFQWFMSSRQAMPVCMLSSNLGSWGYWGWRFGAWEEDEDEEEGGRVGDGGIWGNGIGDSGVEDSRTGGSGIGDSGFSKRRAGEIIVREVAGEKRRRMKWMKWKKSPWIC